MSPRILRSGQRADLIVLDVATGERSVVHSSSTLLFEAPNWTSDGRWLVVNGDGRLFRLPAAGAGELEEIELDGVPPINNDHVVSPDARTVYVSAEDGQLYAIPTQGGASRRISNDHGPHFQHYLHGVSPDGETLAYIGLVRDPDAGVTTNVFTIPSAGGADSQVTNDRFADDGAEFGPDGRWIYFNSERGSTATGHAQLFRIPSEGGFPEQLTDDERVNWFPHPSPDGSAIAYVSFPPGTLGHPADVPVVIRLLDASGKRDLVTAFGGQGTMNVPSWSPDGTRFAYVDYPIAAP